MTVSKITFVPVRSVSMPSFVDKLMHFVVGLAVGAGYWWLLERYAKVGVKRINPIWYLVMLIWGASGLFLFRKLNIPVLSGDQRNGYKPRPYRTALISLNFPDSISKS
jgi:hypothetical protein